MNILDGVRRRDLILDPLLFEVVRALAKRGPMTTTEILDAIHRTEKKRSQVVRILKKLWLKNLIDASLPIEKWSGRTPTWSLNFDLWNETISEMIFTKPSETNPDENR